MPMTLFVNIWDDEKCRKTLDDARVFEETVWKRKVCFYTDTDGKGINPFRLIKEGQYPICTMVLNWVLQQDFDSVYRFIQECKLLSDIKREFYLRVIKERVELLKNINKDLNSMQLF